MTAGVLVVGDLLLDVLVHASTPVTFGSDAPSQIELVGGGSAANTAAWLAEAGADVRFCTRVGDDEPASLQQAELEALGVECVFAVDPEARTGICCVVVTPDGERTMFPSVGASGLLLSADVPDELIERSAHVHVSGYTLLHLGSRQCALSVLRRARDAGVPTSVDASSVAPIVALGAERVREWLSLASLIFANADEARLLAATDDPLAAADALAALAGRAVVKLGADGAVAVTDAGERLRVPAADVGVLDTTGAGDAFAAGFLSGRIAGLEDVDALRRGAETAGRCVLRRGARPPAPVAV